jgi:cytochrome c
VKHVGAVIVLSTIAVVGTAFVHPCGNPRVEPAHGLDTWIERDIVEARMKMNLEKWAQVSVDTQDALVAKIIRKVKSGDIADLRMMNRADEGKATLSGLGDAARGKLIFQKRCTGCHAMEGDREGPRLAGVFGRKAGSVAGFDYSAGLKNSGMTWNETTLEKWLTDPDLVVPDTKMDFHVPKTQERSDLIAYFKQLK